MWLPQSDDVDEARRRLGMNPIIGVVVGGQSRRMGRPKAILPLGETTLLEQTVCIARDVADEVLLLGRPVHDIPASLDAFEVLEDVHPGIGPMAGLEAMLLARPGQSCILLACDMPYLCAALLRRLAEAEGDFDAAVCRTERRVDIAHLEEQRAERRAGPACDPTAGAQWHPCCALYRPSAMPAVQAAIAARRHGMISLLDRLRVRPMDLAGAEAMWATNWNTPQDIDQPAETFETDG